jgi:DNA-binding MarR family transcriptional regulator
MYCEAMPKGLLAELKQTKPFPSRGAEALVSILRTSAILEHQLGEAMRPFRITPTQHNVLRILRGAGPAGLCGREVAERMVARVPDVPRLLERMEAHRLVSRERDAADRRHVTARITTKGLDLLEQVDPVIAALERARLGRLSERTLVGLIDGLAAVRDGT